jgi:hypothetical protein
MHPRFLRKRKVSERLFLGSTARLVVLYDRIASALFGALDPHDARGEEDAGNRQRQHSVRLIAIVDSHRRINPPDRRAHEPDKGKIPHSHRGYLNDYSSQCDNSALIRYFGNPKQNHRFHPTLSF